MIHNHALLSLSWCVVCLQCIEMHWTWTLSKYIISYFLPTTIKLDTPCCHSTRKMLPGPAQGKSAAGEHNVKSSQSWRQHSDNITLTAESYQWKNTFLYIFIHTVIAFCNEFSTNEFKNYFQLTRYLCAEYCKDIQHPPGHSIRIRRGLKYNLNIIYKLATIDI